MQNTKIIQFLKCLSKDELREFGKFVRSPFHNNRKDVVRLYDLLKKFYPVFNISEETKKSIYGKLYPGKKFNAASFVLLNSYLYNLGKGFLSISVLKDDQFNYRYNFLKGLDRHSANSLFEKEFKSTEGFLNAGKLNQQFFYHKSLLEELNINYNLKRNRQDKICGNTVHFGELFIFSFIVKLSVLYHDLLADKSAFNYEFTDSAAGLFVKNFQFEKFIAKLSVKDKLHSNFLIYYYYLFMCVYNPTEENYYQKLKEYTFKDFEDLNESEKSGRFLYLINYCILQIEAGNLKYLRESFNIYTETFERKLHQADSKDLGLMYFRNFVLVGLAAGEFDYIEKFISEHGKELQEDHRDELLRLCYAMLHFEKKEYSRALDYLSKMDNSYPSFRLGIKHLYAKIYYEINDYDSFFPLIDSYKHYLKNDKTIPDRTRELHSAFLNYIGRFAKMKSSDSRDNMFAIKKELKANTNLDFRHKLWLIAKAEEFSV